MAIEFTELTQDSRPPVGEKLLAKDRESYSVVRFKGGDPLDGHNWKRCGNLRFGFPDAYAVI